MKRPASTKDSVGTGEHHSCDFRVSGNFLAEGATQNQPKPLAALAVKVHVLSEQKPLTISMQSSKKLLALFHRFDPTIANAWYQILASKDPGLICFQSNPHLLRAYSGSFKYFSKPTRTPSDRALTGLSESKAKEISSSYV